MDWNLTSFLPSYRNCIWKQFSARPKFKQRYAWGSRVGFSDHSVWKNCPEAGPGQCGSGYIKSYPHHSNCPYCGLLPEDSAAGQMLPPAGRRHGQERVYAGRVPGGPSAHPCPDSEGSWASSWFRGQGKGLDLYRTPWSRGAVLPEGERDRKPLEYLNYMPRSLFCHVLLIM